MYEPTAYSPKEIAAFQGLFRLAACGKHFSSIKVQDIATAAGIGKGTLYEYFSSKEEILSSAVVYAMEKIVGWMEKQLKNPVSLYQILDGFVEELQTENLLPFSSLISLISMVSMEQRKQIQEQNHERMRRILAQMQQYEQQIFAIGRKNGEIAPELDDIFCEYVVISALAGIAGRNLGSHQCLEGKNDWDMARKLVFRSLRP